MLGSNYQELLACVMRDAAWDIQLPATMERFFRETGTASGIQGDERRTARLIVRTKCLLIPELPLPSFPRDSKAEGIYTSDISRQGVGFLASRQFLPEEEVRLILPTFWLRAIISRARRLGPNCYQIGARLVSRHDPTTDAFAILEKEPQSV